MISYVLICSFTFSPMSQPVSQTRLGMHSALRRHDCLRLTEALAKSMCCCAAGFSDVLLEKLDLQLGRTVSIFNWDGP